MMSWDPDQYHRFSAERRAPFEDLVRLLAVRPGLRVIDLGCGTGELTAELAGRLPGAEVLGIDSSATMLERAAGRARPGLRFAKRRIEEVQGSFDLIFSHAALHWLPDHPALFERLLQLLRSGGQLLVQMPRNHRHPAHRLADQLAAEEPYASALGGWVRRFPVLELEEYGHLLHGMGLTELSLAEKVYLHPLADAGAVAEWTRATTLLPYLERLGELAGAYLVDYRRRLTELMPGAPLLYSFRRILLSARRP